VPQPSSKHPRHLVARHFLALLAFGSALGCGSRRELREWQASDHPAPPAVAPEGQGAAAEGPESEARAIASLWAMRCGTCHGEAGRGDGPGRPPGVALPDLGDPAFHAARSDAQLASVIREGRGMMPAFADQLTDAGVAALVTHVRTLKRP
jgi:mono/diheme cytochrome c family protein